jgi:hypothetical protein
MTAPHGPGSISDRACGRGDRLISVSVRFNDPLLSLKVGDGITAVPALERPVPDIAELAQKSARPALSHSSRGLYRMRIEESPGDEAGAWSLSTPHSEAERGDEDQPVSLCSFQTHGRR